MRVQNPSLIKQRELAVGLQNALEHEHHIWASCVILIEYQRHGAL